MRAVEIALWCEDYLGTDWREYFYPEFWCALWDGQYAYQYMSERKIQGATTEELMNDYRYGLFMNIAEYHPNMDALCERLLKG